MMATEVSLLTDPTLRTTIGLRSETKIFLRCVLGIMEGTAMDIGGI
jgi:hypothetical protein